MWDELKIMKELNPEEAQALEPTVYDVLEVVLYNDATATAEWAAYSTDLAKETMAATLYNDATATAEAIAGACWDAFGVSCDDAIATAEAVIRTVATPTIEATLTPAPSATLQPMLTPTPQATTTPAPTLQWSNTGILLAIMAIGLVLIAVVVYLVLKRR